MRKHGAWIPEFKDPGLARLDRIAGHKHATKGKRTVIRRHMPFAELIRAITLTAQDEIGKTRISFKELATAIRLTVGATRKGWR